MATEAPYLTNPIATSSAHRSRVRRGSSGPDRLTVVLFSMAAFLVVLALLASQLRAVPAHTGARPVLVLRKEYRTTVIETIANGSGPGGTSVSQSVSSSSAGGTAVAAPTTRSS
jgi:hypothetical protein